MIRELCEVESAAVAAFMLNLCERDRHLRFCRPMIDSAIRDYVAAIDWENAAVLGAFDDSAQLIGLLELCDAGTGAELAVVVAVDHREHGVAHALMLRGLRKAKAMGKAQVILTCLTENIPMRRLARSVGLGVIAVAAEDTELPLQAPQIDDLMCEDVCELANKVIYGGALHLARAPGSRGSC